MTTDNEYFERGISRLHGFLTEYYVDDPEYIVKIPQGLKDVAVLLEPMTVVQKGMVQAYEIQRRLKMWRPRTAAVMGAGTIGLLATLALRLRKFPATSNLALAEGYAAAGCGFALETARGRRLSRIPWMTRSTEK